ncbi:MAG: biotin synthase BioB [Lachnoclostridium sp.]|nr:biotin synthase BioB [Lachnoclostridium sp.]MCM1383679.1 biotin synthase BioB [Lachnoclostridium sp.]
MDTTVDLRPQNDSLKIGHLKDEVMQGKRISREEALWLYEQPLEELCGSADEIRAHFCRDTFDICTIINGKSGRCSENCKFCAQSAHNHTKAEEYPLLSAEEIVAQAKKNDEQGVLRYSIVTSGRRLSEEEVDRMCEAVRRIKKETDIEVCISFGLLRQEQYQKLKEAGVTRVHNNLETSRRNFPNICTTHSFEDKLEAIRAAQAAGLTVCSGGIMGLGETKEDRIDMAFTLRELGIESVPVNMLNPIPGTPFERNQRLTTQDMCRIVAVYRFILPKAFIRLAGGRGLFGDKGRSCFLAGANAAISGDMLTTAGITVETDMELLKDLGYVVRKESR